MVSRRRWIAATLLLALASAALPAAAGSSAEPPLYTAQRKPRVAVMIFGDTNSSADFARFGPAVSAMLVTFLKRNGHFVVVERQDLDELLAEWDRIQGGKTKPPLAGDTELLERIDVILQGEVTLLEGRRIEIDARLLSRSDGRIITVAERSGPEGCLRQVVTRLGTALEEDFLRPYYGRLRVRFEEPENTRIYLTPILRTDALDEEKPPVELESTVYTGENKDRREQWITSPRTYTIENLLSGWYTLRLERPGYVEARTDATRYTAVVAGGTTRICYWDEEGKCVPLERAGPEAERYAVHVRPWGGTEIDATSRGFELRKEKGAIRLVAEDESGHPLPGARVYLRSLDLRINPESPDRGVLRRWPETPIEKMRGEERQPHGEEDGARGRDESISGSREESVTARAAAPDAIPADGAATSPKEQRSCDYVDDVTLPAVDYGEQLVRTPAEYAFESFKGGFLAFTDYRGEALPTGVYELVVWAPFRRPVHRLVNIAAGEMEGRESRIRLERWSRDVQVLGRAATDVRLVAQGTGATMDLSVTGNHGSSHFQLPVDRYSATLRAHDASGWERRLDLYPAVDGPPVLDEFLTPPPRTTDWFRPELPEVDLKVKTGLWVGGRVERFLQIPDVYYDLTFADLLDEALSVSASRRERRRVEGKESDLGRLAQGLEDLDLLILDEADMSRLAVLPKVSEVIRAWVEEGHALMSFVAERGDYSKVLGVPLEIARTPRRSRYLRLREGKVPGFAVDEKVDLGHYRWLPRIKHPKQALAGWKVLSFQQKRKVPRVLEREVGNRGGYVMVWLDRGDLAPSHTIAESLVRPWYAHLVKLIGVPLDPRVPEGGEEADRPLSNREKRAVKEAKRKNEEAKDRVLLVRARFKNRALEAAERLLRRRLQFAAAASSPVENASSGQP